jgi:hypothetical protein
VELGAIPAPHQKDARELHPHSSRVSRGGGTVFKVVHQTSGWFFAPVYSFDTSSTGNGIDPQSPW